MGARLPGDEIHRGGRCKTVVPGPGTQTWAWPWCLTRGRESRDLNLTLQSKFSVLSVSGCSFSGMTHSDALILKCFGHTPALDAVPLNEFIDWERHLASFLAFFFFFFFAVVVFCFLLAIALVSYYSLETKKQRTGRNSAVSCYTTDQIFECPSQQISPMPSQDFIMFPLHTSSLSVLYLICVELTPNDGKKTKTKTVVI